MPTKTASKSHVASVRDDMVGNEKATGDKGLPRHRLLELVGIMLTKNSVSRKASIDDQLSVAGLTSLDMVNLMLEVEAEFEVTIPGSEITPENFRSIATIEALILKLKRSS